MEVEEESQGIGPGSTPRCAASILDSLPPIIPSMERIGATATLQHMLRNISREMPYFKPNR